MRRIARLTLAATLIAGTALAATILPATAFAADSGAPTSGFVQGFDVSNFQSNADGSTVDFGAAVSNGAKFVYIKAGDAESLESPAYTPSPVFAQQWSDAGAAGLTRGAYVVPGMGNGSRESSPSTEANDFVAQVSAAIQAPYTLPPMIDLEAGATTTCWMENNSDWNANLAANQRRMVAWLTSFSATVTKATGRAPIIYTNQTWWNTCTGGSSAFRSDDLFVANYTSNASPAMPRGWSSYTLWQWRADAQNTATGFPGDQDVFHGSLAALNTLAATPMRGVPVPKISGTAKVAYTLTASTGTWPTGTTVRYKWYANGVVISGATSRTYVVAPAEAGKKITVTTTGSAAGYATTTTTSAATRAVALGSFASHPVTITGTLKVGSTLVGHSTTWAGSPTYTWQWYANGVAIKGATRSTLRLSSAQYAKSISVTLTGTRKGYATSRQTSARTHSIGR